MRAEPDMARIRDAMQNLPDADRRWQSILNAGAIAEIDVHEGSLYIQCAGNRRSGGDKAVSGEIEERRDAVEQLRSDFIDLQHEET